MIVRANHRIPMIRIALALATMVTSVGAAASVIITPPVWGMSQTTNVGLSSAPAQITMHFPLLDAPWATDLTRILEAEQSVQMRQVSCGKFGLRKELLAGLIEVIDGGGERAIGCFGTAMEQLG